MTKRSESAERALFYSIWAVILIGVALWRFRPVPEAQVVDVPISLSKELRPWFSEGVVQRSRGNSLTIGLSLTSDYRRTLRQGRTEILLGYRISSGEGTSAEGAATVRLSPDTTLGTTLIQHDLKERPVRLDLFLRQ
jgi:hypothetical protein